MQIEIIAELAQGFEGRPEQARLLMKAAASAGADAAKYQLVYADELATPDYKYYDLFRSLEMPDDVWA
jgi:N,N'-diacetyllegionaminate synthase